MRKSKRVPGDVTPIEAVSDTEATSSRRSWLRRAGAVAVGGAAVAVTRTGTASAAALDPMVLGTAMDSGAASTTLNSSNATTFSATSTNTVGDGLLGASDNDGSGVHGFLGVNAGASGAAVWGEVDAGATNGYAIFATGGAAHLFLEPYATTGTPATTGIGVGAVLSNDSGVFVCVVSDGVAADVWRKIAGPASAGAFHAIAPARVHDSRKPTSNPIHGNDARTISVKDQIAPLPVVPDIVPPSATAVSYNLTVTGTVGTGFLAVNDAGNVTVSASSINWFATGQTLSNASVVKLGGDRQVRVFCGGGSCNFIIDIVGYYL